MSSVTCESAAPAAKSVPDLAKVLHLPRTLFLTLPAVKSVPDLAKALCLPQNMHLTLRKCCACREIYTVPCESAAPAAKSVPDLLKVLCLLYCPCERAAHAAK